MAVCPPPSKFQFFDPAHQILGNVKKKNEELGPGWEIVGTISI